MNASIGVNLTRVGVAHTLKAPKVKNIVPSNTKLTMLDYNLGHRRLCKNSLQEELNFIEKNIKSYPLLEKLLGFTYFLQSSLYSVGTQIINDVKEPKRSNSPNQLMTETCVMTTCTLNLNSIWQAIRPLEQNSFLNCATLIRPVYESIPKMFYVLRHPEKIKEIILHEEFSWWLSQQRFNGINPITIPKQHESKTSSKDYEYLYLEHYLTYVPSGKNLQSVLCIDVSKNSYKNFRGKYNNKWFREKIYTKESLKIQNVTYDSLSMYSHANFSRASVLPSYNKIESPRFFKILTDLAFFNLYVFFNGAFETIQKIGERDDTIKFIVDVQNELGSYCAMTKLYPDVPEYTEKLRLYPESQ